MSFTKTDTGFELRSGQAVLAYSQAGDGLYKAEYKLGRKTVFSTTSFTGGNYALLIERVEACELNGEAIQLGGCWQSARQTGDWQGQARVLTDHSGWFRLNASFTLDQSLEIERAELAPAFALTPANQGQTVRVNQPTEHNPPVAWLRSNDLPASYLWDGTTGSEAILFPDLEGCDWFQRDGLNRLADYRSGLFDDNHIFGFQLRPDSAKRPATIPAGTYNLCFKLFLGERREKPDEWQAVRALIEGCAELLPGAPVIQPPENVSWLEFARLGREELMLGGLCWMEDAVRGYVAYVQEPSQLQRNGGPLDERIEAMASLDALPPWLVALRLWPDPAQEEHVVKVAASLAHHYSPEHQIFVNQVDLHTGLPLVKHPNTQVGAAYGDSWYFFEPLLRLGWCAHLTPQGEVAQNLRQIFLVSCRRAIDFIRKHHYRPAAFYDPLTLEPFNQAIPPEAEDFEVEFWTGTAPGSSKPWLNWFNTSQNWACLGLYAYIMLQAHNFSGESIFMEEADKALDALAGCPPDTMFWEPFELSYAIAAASLTGKDGLAANLAANLLRMGYWHDETILPGRPRPRRGLFQAWAGIRYPAQKENGETLLALLPWLRRVKNDAGIVRAVLKFFNLARASALYHYTPLLEPSEIYSGRVETPTPHIPLEDLEMFEWLPVMHISKSQTVPQLGQLSGAIGREIYGAGETTWFALMFEALAEPSDPAVMLLNLDLFDWEMMADFPRHREQSFVLYNPNGPVNLAVKFKALQPGAKYRLQYGERSSIIAANQDGRFTLRNLELVKDEWIHLKLQWQGEAFK